MGKKISRVAVGHDELRACPRLGPEAHCNGCGGRHPVEHGEEVLADGTRKPCTLLAFVKCPETGSTYLVGIGGRELRLPRGDSKHG